MTPSGVPWFLSLCSLSWHFDPFRGACMRPLPVPALQCMMTGVITSGEASQLACLLLHCAALSEGERALHPLTPASRHVLQQRQQCSCWVCSALSTCCCTVLPCNLHAPKVSGQNAKQAQQHNPHNMSVSELTLRVCPAVG